MRTFEDVVRGGRTVHRVGEDDRHLAFLSPSPVRPGHTIVIPKRVSDQILDLPVDEYAALMEFVRVTGLRLRRALPCERVCLAVIGWQVRHRHVHLVPTDADGQFPPLPGASMPDDELARIASRISEG